jgi:putative tryptophan/tyrosine transport system substrate-binding protein
MRRREFMAALTGAAAWPLGARAQPPARPVIGFIHPGSAEAATRYVTAFRKSLNEAGYVEGQNIAVEYHWLEGQYDGLAALTADLIQRQVAVIATPGSTRIALAVKAATSTIPIVFGVSDDPVRLGLVASLDRPGGNATGINYFQTELAAKRLRLLHDLVPKAVRIAVLINPTNGQTAQTTLREVQEAAPAMGLQLQLFSAATIGEIDMAFAAIAREHPDALYVVPDIFYAARAAQLAVLTARNRIPSAYWNRDIVVAGGFMSYGTDVADMFRQVGTYTGSILKGTKPADLPVQQSTKFEFVINLQTARALDIEVHPSLLAIADDVIE